MAEKILGPAGSKRRKRFLWVPALLIACTALFVIGNAQAVHDLQFQLDGNADTSCGTGPNCKTTGTGAGQIYDWSSLFSSSGAVNTDIVKASNTVGFTNATFTRDFKSKTGRNGTCALDPVGSTFCTSDDTTYATGSKDTLPIAVPSGSDWQCNQDNNVNSKIDIMNSYAAAYTAPNGDKILYFGLDKNKDNGDNDVGFWFLQGDAGCTSAGGATDFTGIHHDGDILITSAFTSGGGVSNIEVFKWQGDNATGCIDNPANPTLCDQEPFGAGGDCKSTQTSTTTAPADAICATTNSGSLPSNGNIQTPWKTADATLGIGNTVVPPDFFEGGIDLTLAFKNVGSTAPSCFNTFIADTRSSQQPTATLFDFTAGTLGECHTTVTTQYGGTGTGQSNPDANIGNGVASSGTDTANVQVIGSSNFSGTLYFYLCGPDASLTKCDRGGTDPASPTNGALITTTTNVTANGNYNSGTASLTKAGHYCWSAHFQPNQASLDAGIGPGDDDGTNECFTVAKVTPTIQTCSGTWDTSGQAPVCTAAGTVNFGSSVSDTALVAGLAKEPGSGGGAPSHTYPTINPTTAGAYTGSIEFKLFGPGVSGTCGSLATGTPSGGNDQTTNINTSTGNGQYSPANAFTPDHAGLFHWAATLSGTSLNNILPVSDDANCDDADEAVTIRTIPTNLKSRQSWFPNDTAVLASSLAGDDIQTGGTVDFFLYNSTDCSGSAVYNERHTLVAGDLSGTPKTATVNTVNYPNGGGTAVSGTWAAYRITSLLADTGVTVHYSWKVVYTPASGDTAHEPRQAGCTPAATGNGVAGDAASIETFDLTYTNDNSGGKKP